MTGENGHDQNRPAAPSLVVAVAVGHGEHVAVKDAELDVKGHDGVLALVVLPATLVRL